MKFKSLNLILLSVVLTSCSVGRDYSKPEYAQNLDDSFKQENTESFKAKAPVEKWWRNLEDKQLTSLIEKSLEHNYDIQIAIANLEQSRAILDKTEYDYFPTPIANVAAKKEKFSNDGLFPGGKQNTFSTSLDAVWELDLFGRITQGVKGAEATSEAREADLRNAYISVAAEVASAYIELRGAQHRLDVAQRNSDNQAKSFELTQTLQEAGLSDMLDTERARTQLELTKSTIPLLEAQVNAAMNRLGVLTGQKPATLHVELAEVKPVPSIPEAINIGEPIDLIKRRPDISRVERELAVATAEYNLNVANLYPKVSLLGNIGFSTTDFSTLGNAGTSTFLYGPSIDWSGFNLGSVIARIDAADAATRAKAAEFHKTILTALEEIDTNMMNFSSQEKSRERLFQAANSSAKAAEYAQDRFDAGIDSFLDVLDAQRTMLDAQDRLAVSEAQTALKLIAIYKSLGGGWYTKEESIEKIRPERLVKVKKKDVSKEIIEEDLNARISIKAVPKKEVKSKELDEIVIPKTVQIKPKIKVIRNE